jgi:hypothetical protein
MGNILAIDVSGPINGSMAAKFDGSGLDDSKSDYFRFDYSRFDQY